MKDTIDCDIPLSVRTLLRRGYRHKVEPPDISSEERELCESRRILARRWRNLIGELKYDLPRDLWNFIDMRMPKDWHKLRDEKGRFIRFKYHDFYIKLPDFATIGLEYKNFSNTNDWYFARFEIVAKNGQSVSSDKYEDLPLFLAIAHELGKPAKYQTKIEEIQCGGSLADNARSQPVFYNYHPDTRSYDYPNCPRINNSFAVGTRKHEYYDHLGLAFVGVT
jgi:hypothetical protein